MGAEEFVERGGNLRRLLFHHLAGARLEIAPEAVEHRLPLRAAARHVVEFLLELGGEVITDIAGEESFEEGGQEPPALLGDERSAEHTSELQSLMRITYAVFC